MNKKLIKGALAGVAAITVAAGGTTLAAWSDFDVVSGNAVEAGHLVLDTNTPSGAINNVGGQAIAPGEFRTIDFFVSSADLDGVPLADLSMKIINIVDAENGCEGNSEVVVDGTCATAGDPGEFSGQAYTRIRYSDPTPVSQITYSPSNQCAAPGGLVHSVGYAPASNNDPSVYPRLAALTGNQSLGTLAADQGVCIRVDLGLEASATNAVQGDSSTFDLQFDLVQN